jgi:murein DD-endopeptidase MepM/ murein hydrolase activator NlpD
VRRVLAALAIGVWLLSLQASGAVATTPTPCPSPTVASDGRITCPQPVATDPNQAAYDHLKSRLGGDVARALAAQQRLALILRQFAAIEDSLSAEITAEEATIAALAQEIARLNREIADTQARITVEKQQLAAMSRVIYRQPDSLWILIARTGNLHDALIATADAVVAGQRAHALEERLQADLDKLNADLAKREQDMEHESNTLDLLNANITSLQDVIARQNVVSASLAVLLTQLENARAHITSQAPDVTETLAELLEAQERDLILRSYQTAWTQAQVGTGLALLNGKLQASTPIAGLTLSWPMAKFRITQVFGPTAFALEPPFGPYPHFHTGIDISAPLGTPVMAAADGVVVAVGHSASGYGNYVVIAHGTTIETLYGHLLTTRVKYLDSVKRGQVIGLEGSTGFSTGPHVHFELRVGNLVTDPMPYMPIPGTNWSGQ